MFNTFVFGVNQLITETIFFLFRLCNQKKSKLLPLLLLLQAQDDLASWLGWAEWLD